MLSEKCSGKISPCVRNPGGAKRQNYICQAIRTDVQQLRQCAERAGHQQHHSRNVQTVLILGALMQQHHFCKNSGQAEQRYRCNCCRVFVICEKRERCAVDKGSSHRNAAMETLSGTKQFKQGNADQRGNTGKIISRIGALPDQVIGQPQFSAGANQEIHIRQTSGIQMICNGLLRDGFRGKHTCLHFFCNFLCSMLDFVPAAVIDGENQVHLFKIFRILQRPCAHAVPGTDLHRRDNPRTNP